MKLTDYELGGLKLTDGVENDENIEELAFDFEW